MTATVRIIPVLVSLRWTSISHRLPETLGMIDFFKHTNKRSSFNWFQSCVSSVNANEGV